MINFAVIGVGSFGLKRAKAIKECSGANLIALCDKFPKFLKKQINRCKGFKDIKL